ncbi:MAG TPA: FAD-binding oxidoreductase [Thermomicrobiales bacterium]|nr:FAD-binding oxidoreductase [Thermomicrobiales bacterium]
MASILSNHSTLLEAPATPRELANILAEAAASGNAITPVGGGSKLAFGNPLSRDTIKLSTAKLNRVLAYEPDDMTLSVEAGATMASVWQTLAERGLTIPIDVPLPESETIGGLIATGLCGPRRYGSGSLRDALIGIQAAYPDGTLGNAGGMVVKNVSGFDLMRMHLGALGTLGVVVSANFKLVPAARAEATVLVERATFDQLEGDRLAIHVGRIRPIAYESRRTGDHWTESIRIEGRPATVDQMARELADRLGDATLLSRDESRQFWNGYVRTEAIPTDPELLTLQVRGRPTEISATTTAALSAFADSIEDIRASPGLGTVRLVVRSGAARSGDHINAIAELRASGRSVLLLSAPQAVHAGVEAFGTPESNLELMRQLKRQFDPWSALNPGRVIPEL